MKSNQTELNNVMTEMERIALVNPGIAFSLYHNEVELMNVSQATMRQRIQHLFGIFDFLHLSRGRAEVVGRRKRLIYGEKIIFHSLEHIVNRFFTKAIS